MDYHYLWGLKELSYDLFSTGGKHKFVILEINREYLCEFVIFFLKYFLIARFHQVIATHIKNLSIVNTLVDLGTRLKVPILAVFGDFSSCPFWNKPLI